MTRLLIGALTAACLMPAGAAAAPAAADLEITIRNVLPGQGELRIALFDTADGFPNAPAPTQPTLRQRADADMVRVSFPGLPQGRWAVMVLQDLNGNGRIIPFGSGHRAGTHQTNLLLHRAGQCQCAAHLFLRHSPQHFG